MSIGKWLGLGEEVAKPIEAIGGLYTTEKERIGAETEFQKVVQEPQLRQLENNKIMLASSRFFESAWPALIGWTSGACVFLYWVPQIVLADYMYIKHFLVTGEIVSFPIKPDEIYNLIWLLFGFGGYNLIKKKIG